MYKLNEIIKKNNHIIIIYENKEIDRLFNLLSCNNIEVNIDYLKENIWIMIIDGQLSGGGNCSIFTADIKDKYTFIKCKDIM